MTAPARYSPTPECATQSQHRDNVDPGVTTQQVTRDRERRREQRDRCGGRPETVRQRDGADDSQSPTRGQSRGSNQ